MSDQDLNKPEPEFRDANLAGDLSMEPNEPELRDTLRAQWDDLPEPVRLVLSYVAVDVEEQDADGNSDLDNAIMEIAEFAAERGVFFEWGANVPLELDDIPPNSPLLNLLRQQLR